MKISSRIEGSLCGAILSPRRALWSSTSCGGGIDNSRTVHGGGQWRSRRRQQQGVGTARRPSASRHQRAEQVFFTPWIPPPILVKALPYTSRASDSITRLKNLHTTRRWRHSAAEQEVAEEEEDNEEDQALRPGSHQDKKEMLALVDQIQQGNVSDYLGFQRDPYMRGYAPADGPVLTVSERLEDKNFPNFDEIHGASSDPTQRLVVKLWRAINRRLANPYKTDINYIYDLYLKLPEPRITYLHFKIRRKLLKVMGREEKDRKAMLRYFAIVADVQQAGLRLRMAEWNAATSFAARWVGHSKDKEAKAALQIWKQMETDAGLKGNAVTFNILFDVASKAGNFVLADMLYQEMEKRNLPWNRYHHVSLIHFFGLKKDSDGIRAAYKEMVEAGELIDTVVLNCVIAGFLRCGEEDSAERVYERMKKAHESAPMMPYRNYMKDSVISKVLMMFTKIGKEAEKKRPKRKSSGGSKVKLGASEGGAKSDTKTDLGTATNNQDAGKPSSKGLGMEYHDVASNTQAKADTGAGAEGESDGGALRRHFQNQSSIVPDLQTYRILLNHYAVRFSALDRIAHFLDDMKWFKIPIHAAVFLALFKGFAIHGGPGQKWSRERLNTVYGAFSAALAENANGMYMDPWMAKWILRAFRKCDTEDRLWEVWAEIKPRCESDFEDEDIAKFEDFLVQLMHPEKKHYTYSDTGMFGEVDPGRWGRGWRV